MPIVPLPYHQRVVDLLRHEVPESWRWYAQIRQSAQVAEQNRIELLKCTYRLDRAAHAALYQRADTVAASLGLDAPITCYQAQGAGGGINASLWFQADEVHIVFHGQLLETLSPIEVDAVIAHELGHFRLWRCDDGVFGIADRLLAAIVDRPEAEACHVQTFRRWNLATEVFADRCSLLATGDIAAVVSTLVRVETGAATVDAKSYLGQAEEVLASGADRAQGSTHPECFIRAVALEAFRSRGAAAEPQVERLLVGPLDPSSLDVFGQRSCEGVTRQAIAAMLAPVWMRSTRTIAHARQFFPDEVPGTDPNPTQADFADASPGLRDYVCFLLLDFAAADGDLGEAALARALEVANRWGWADRLAELANRELKWKAKDLARLRRELAAVLAAADAQVRVPPPEGA
jgi:hypothetical protein